MIILGIDTCTNILDCAVIEDGVVLAQDWSDNKKTHSERALPMVEQVLNQAGISVNDVDAFVATIGPGSYTGLRIGAATVLALAQGAGKQAKGISSLKLMALSEGEISGKIICPIIDARRDAVYNALYKWENSELLSIEQERRIDLAQLQAKLAGEDVLWLEPKAGKWKFIQEKYLEKIEFIYLGGQI